MLRFSNGRYFERSYRLERVESCAKIDVQSYGERVFDTIFSHDVRNEPKLSRNDTFGKNGSETDFKKFLKFLSQVRGWTAAARGTVIFNHPYIVTRVTLSNVPK